MSAPHRPWWLLINQPAGLVTTIQDQSRPGERVFVVRGEPVVQGLAWLTCGPLAALLALAVVVGLALSADARTQPGMVRLAFIGAFLGLPALAWGLAVVAANMASARPVQAIKAAQTQECTIRMNQQLGQLSYQSAGAPGGAQLDYANIRQAHVTPALGATDSKSVYLSLETDDGPVVLLNEQLGSHAQKADLALEIETALQQFAYKKIPPHT